MRRLRLVVLTCLVWLWLVNADTRQFFTPYDAVDAAPESTRLRLWLSADSINVTNGDYVADPENVVIRWDDKSPDNHVLLQGNTTVSPRIYFDHEIGSNVVGFGTDKDNLIRERHMQTKDEFFSANFEVMRGIAVVKPHRPGHPGNQGNSETEASWVFCNGAGNDRVGLSVDTHGMAVKTPDARSGNYTFAAHDFGTDWAVVSFTVGAALDGTDISFRVDVGDDDLYQQDQGLVAFTESQSLGSGVNLNGVRNSTGGMFTLGASSVDIGLDFTTGFNGSLAELILFSSRDYPSSSSIFRIEGSLCAKYRIDCAHATPYIVHGRPAPGSESGIAPGEDTITLTFSLRVQKGSGNIVLKRHIDNGTLDTVAVGSAAVVIFDDFFVNVTFGTPFAAGTKVYVTFDGGVFESLSSTGMAALMSPNVYFFTPGNAWPDILTMEPERSTTKAWMWTRRITLTFSQDMRVNRDCDDCLLELYESDTETLLDAVSRSRTHCAGSTCHFYLRNSVTFKGMKQYHVVMSPYLVTNGGGHPVGNAPTNREDYTFVTQRGCRAQLDYEALGLMLHFDAGSIDPDDEAHVRGKRYVKVWQNERPGIPDLLARTHAAPEYAITADGPAIEFGTRFVEPTGMDMREYFMPHGSGDLGYGVVARLKSRAPPADRRFNDEKAYYFGAGLVYSGGIGATYNGFSVHIGACSTSNGFTSKGRFSTNYTDQWVTLTQNYDQPNTRVEATINGADTATLFSNPGALSAVGTCVTYDYPFAAAGPMTVGCQPKRFGQGDRYFVGFMDELLYSNSTRTPQELYYVESYIALKRGLMNTWAPTEFDPELLCQFPERGVISEEYVGLTLLSWAYTEQLAFDGTGKWVALSYRNGTVIQNSSASDPQLFINESSLYMKLDHPLREGYNYTVDMHETLLAAADDGGPAGTSPYWFVADAVPPQLTASIPRDGQVLTNLDPMVKLFFQEPIFKDNNSAVPTLHDADTHEQLSSAFFVSVLDGTQLVLLFNYMPAYRRMYMRMPNDTVMDTVGNNYVDMSGPNSIFVFSTSSGTYPPVSFAPSSLPGLQLWLDAGDTSTLNLQGSKVRAWGDKAGSDVYFSASASLPDWEAGSLEGTGYVTFPGADVDPPAVLAANSMFSVQGMPSPQVFAVMRANGISAPQAAGGMSWMIQVGSSFSNASWGVSYKPGQINARCFSDWMAEPVNAGSGQFVAASVTFEPGVDVCTQVFPGEKTCQAGVTVGSTVYLMPQATQRYPSEGPMTLGGSAYTDSEDDTAANASLAEVLLYRERISTNQSYILGAYLGLKYGLPYPPVAGNVLYGTNPPSGGNIPSGTGFTATLRFTRAIAAGPGNVELRRVSDHFAVDTVSAGSLDISLDYVNVTFTGTITPDNAYYLFIAENAFKDRYENTNVAPFGADSKSGVVWYSTPALPALDFVEPASGQSILPELRRLRWEFDGRVKVGQGQVSVRDAETEEVVAICPADQFICEDASCFSYLTYTYKHSALTPGRSYTLTVPRGMLLNMAGQPPSADIVLFYHAVGCAMGVEELGSPMLWLSAHASTSLLFDRRVANVQNWGALGSYFTSDRYQEPISAVDLGGMYLKFGADSFLPSYLKHVYPQLSWSVGEGMMVFSVLRPGKLPPGVYAGDDSQEGVLLAAGDAVGVQGWRLGLKNNRTFIYDSYNETVRDHASLSAGQSSLVSFVVRVASNIHKSRTNGGGWYQNPVGWPAGKSVRQSMHSGRSGIEGPVTVGAATGYDASLLDQYFAGDVVDLLFYNRTMLDSEINKIDAFLSDISSFGTVFSGSGAPVLLCRSPAAGSVLDDPTDRSLYLRFQTGMLPGGGTTTAYLHAKSTGYAVRQLVPGSFSGKLVELQVAGGWPREPGTYYVNMSVGYVIEDPGGQPFGGFSLDTDWEIVVQEPVIPTDYSTIGLHGNQAGLAFGAAGHEIRLFLNAADQLEVTDTNLALEGSLNVSADVQTTGNTTVDLSVTAKQGMQVAGGLTVSSHASVTERMRVEGTLEVPILGLSSLGGEVSARLAEAQEAAAAANAVQVESRAPSYINDGGANSVEVSSADSTILVDLSSVDGVPVEMDRLGVGTCGDKFCYLCPSDEGIMVRFDPSRDFRLKSTFSVADVSHLTSTAYYNGWAFATHTHLYCFPVSVPGVPWIMRYELTAWPAASGFEELDLTLADPQLGGFASMAMNKEGTKLFLAPYLDAQGGPTGKVVSLPTHSFSHLDVRHFDMVDVDSQLTIFTGSHATEGYVFFVTFQSTRLARVPPQNFTKQAVEFIDFSSVHANVSNYIGIHSHGEHGYLSPSNHYTPILRWNLSELDSTGMDTLFPSYLQPLFTSYFISFTGLSTGDLYLGSEQGFFVRVDSNAFAETSLMSYNARADLGDMTLRDYQPVMLSKNGYAFLRVKRSTHSGDEDYPGLLRFRAP